MKMSQATNNIFSFHHTQGYEQGPSNISCDLEGSSLLDVAFYGVISWVR